MMQSAQMQLQNVVESANRDRDRLLALERNLADSLSAAAPDRRAAAAERESQDEPFVGTAAQQLDAAPGAVFAPWNCGSSPSIPTSAAPSG